MRKFLTLWFATCIVLGFSAAKAWAVSWEEQFFEANRLYAQGAYEDAALGYEEILKGGLRSGNLYYNLGNAYFKIGRRGKALVHYERARKFISQDEDLFANLNFVTSLLEIAQPEEEDRSWFQRGFESVQSGLKPSGWFLLSAALYLLIIVLSAVSIFYTPFRKTAFLWAGFLGIPFLLCLIFFFGAEKIEQGTRFGIIIKPEIEVRYSPSHTGAVAFKLSEGIRAELVRQEDSWSQIRLTKKKSGWIESEAVEEI